MGQQECHGTTKKGVVENILVLLPFVGITRIRFKGYNLSPNGAPLKSRRKGSLYHNTPNLCSQYFFCIYTITCKSTIYKKHQEKLYCVFLIQM